MASDMEDAEKITCSICNQLICHDCTVKVAATKKRRALMESLEPLREIASSLSLAVEDIQTMEHLLAAQGQSVANKIETSFEEFHTIIERRKEQLLEEARRNVSEKMEKLQGHKKNLSISGAEVQSIVDYTKQCVEHCHDDDVMYMHAEIECNITKKIEEHKSGRNPILPVEDLDVEVEVCCAEAVEDFFQTQAKISPLRVVIDRIFTKAKVNHLSEVTFYTSTPLINRPLQIDLECLYNAFPITTNIRNIGANQYQVQFTPTLRGRHKLTVSVNGREVTGSPHLVFVSVHPTQLGKLDRFWVGFKHPYGITVNSAGEIIVAEISGDILVLDKVGLRLRTINRSKHKFLALRGVAVDREDNIYFTDIWSNKIFKSNKNCNKVQEYSVSLNCASEKNCGVAVVGDEVIVTVLSNDGWTMVYDRELDYVRKIVSPDNGKFHFISSDSQHNVYVSDRLNFRIVVFNNNGIFLNSFGCDENHEKKLISPWGVCVAGQYVFVADYAVRKIVVFTTEGDYVTSFGDGSFYDVCVDQDGFVYATDGVCSIFVF